MTKLVPAAILLTIAIAGFSARAEKFCGLLECQIHPEGCLIKDDKTNAMVLHGESRMAKREFRHLSDYDQQCSCISGEIATAEQANGKSLTYFTSVRAVVLTPIYRCHEIKPSQTETTPDAEGMLK